MAIGRMVSDVAKPKYSNRILFQHKSNRFDVRSSLHHSTIHKEKSNNMQQCIKVLLFHVYMELNMFRATYHPSSGALNCTGSLWFFIRGRLLDVQLVEVVRQSVPDNVHQLHVQQSSTYEKPEAASAV
jgi:hypothetical protein